MHRLEEEILRHEEEQRRLATSSGRYTSSEHASSSDEHRSPGQAEREADASDLERHEQETLRDLHGQYEEELAAVHSDEEHYRAHYSRLQDEMRHLADQAERVKEEAIHDAVEADERAISAE